MGYYLSYFLAEDSDPFGANEFGREVCPAGYYCDGGNVYPIKCPPGYYCTEGSVSYADSSGSYFHTYVACPAGTYGGPDSLAALEDCKPCPKGHYCPEASIYPTACGPGKYLDTENGESEDACLLCSAGRVCPFYG